MTPLIVGLAALGGAVVGSYVTTAALRATTGEQSIRGRSRCDHCGVSLSFARTMPLVSYAWSGGACGTCGGPIPRAHPVGEAVGAAAAAGSALLPFPAGAFMATLAMVLLAAALIDLRSLILPNGLTSAAAALSLGLAWRGAGDGVLVGLAAAAISCLVLVAVRALSREVDGAPGLGLGDVKLVGALALWLGALTPWVVAMAAGLGLAGAWIGRSGPTRRPFGPMIAISAWSLGWLMEMGFWPSGS
jgi:leader peptidase (prepilin peptidase)/N-methyltransferase